MKWHVIYTHHHQEYRALKRLEEQGYTAYLPEKLIDLRRKMKFKRDKEPLFPRYLFIRLSKTKDDWGPIRSTPGVFGLVKFGQIIPFIEDEFINDFMEYERHYKTDYEVGDKVIFNKESFINVPAIVKSSVMHRVDILMRIMGTEQSISAERWQISPEEV